MYFIPLLQAFRTEIARKAEFRAKIPLILRPNLLNDAESEAGAFADSAMDIGIVI
jgi:hypothetical protein